jgi:hypothetical protein
LGVARNGASSAIAAAVVLAFGDRRDDVGRTPAIVAADRRRRRARSATVTLVSAARSAARIP